MRDATSRPSHRSDEAAEVAEAIDKSLRHPYGCDCFLCIAAYGNPLEDGDDDGPGPF
jgi:hypothetical protein